MIKFSCTCGLTFDLPDHRAGEPMQCPRCMRLLDVPRHDEIDALEPDGTLKLGAAPEHKSDLAGKLRTYSYRGDQRGGLDQFFALDEAPAPDRPPEKLPPHYDPETGELIEALEVIRDEPTPPPQDIPLATPALGYSQSVVEAADAPLRWWQVPWRLLQGTSLMAITFVFLAHVVMHLSLIVPGANIILIPFVLVLALVIAAHYVNVMEEFGPREHDRVPVLLRSVSMSEDVISPLYALFWATLFAFTPVIVALMLGLGGTMRREPLLALALGGWGLAVFPAAAFTMATSGAMQNLLPTHVFSVIIAAPGRYLLACGAFVVGAVAYALVLGQLVFTSLTLLTRTGSTAWSQLFWDMGVMYALVLVAVYAMHLSAAWLGMIYRTHYHKFNWVWQRHYKDPRTDTLAQLQALRRSGQLRPKRAVDPEKMAALRAAEAERRARHAESMRG